MKTETTIDKSKWPRRGPWDSESDKMEWTDIDTGMACLIVRGPSGALCGYVAVEESHPLYEKYYGDLWNYDTEEGTDINVHGGLTYSDFCQEVGRICHTPEEGKPDNVWWFGFDCAHSGDICPSYQKEDMEICGIPYTYKDVDYVTRQVESLARQLKQVEK